MASSKKSGGNSRFEKNVNGRRSSKYKEAPVGEFIFGCFDFHRRRSPPVAFPFNNVPRVTSLCRALAATLAAL